LKSLNPPNVDDVLKTTELSENELLELSSYPHLKTELNEILRGYRDYHLKFGNGLNVSPVTLTEHLKIGLRKNYEVPPKELDYIRTIRKSSPRICPMCGAPKGFTVDHLFPKNDYPCFAVYSKNLVPACDCNLKRGTKFLDGNRRILHPYYDNFLVQRLISCRISPDNAFPLAKIEIHYEQPNHAESESIIFHVETVVIRSGLIDWLISEWENIILNPVNSVPTLPESGPITVPEFRDKLNLMLVRLDNRYETPNNWHSIFIHGILSSPSVDDFLTQKFNSIY
jgi:hypothetical protein